MMREVSRSNSELATRVQSYLSSGTLVPNEIIIEMLVKEFKKKIVQTVFYWMDFQETLTKVRL